MKLIFDEMLRKTVKWARLFGVDSDFITGEDKEILEKLKESDRIFITRDEKLSLRAKKRGIKTVFIKSTSISEQLFEIEKFLGKRLFRPPEKTRCTVCNGILKTIEKEEVKDKVPPAVAKYQDKFWICKNCGKIYWEGGHWENITKMYEELKKKRKGYLSKPAEVS